MIIAIDPGKTGAIAVVDGPRLLDVVDMPLADKQIDGFALAETINVLAMGFNVHAGVIERVAARPKQGVVSTFTFGEGYGIVQGVFAAFGMPVSFVLPQRWKKDLNISADKNDSRIMAQDLWPEHHDWFKRKKDDGRAEAALIGYWKDLFDAD